MVTSRRFSSRASAENAPLLEYSIAVNLQPLAVISETIQMNQIKHISGVCYLYMACDGHSCCLSNIPFSLNYQENVKNLTFGAPMVALT